MKISANGYITIIIISGFLLIGYLFATTPTTAGNQLPLILAGIAGLIVVIRKQGDAEAASESNGAKLALIDNKVDANTAVTETTHKAVNGQMAEFKQALIDVAALKQQVAAVLATATAAKADLAIARERATGITIGREQAAQTIATSDAARADIGTPAHGTTIAPGGPTTIVVDKTADVSIVQDGPQ